MTLDALVIWNDDREDLKIRNDLDEMMSDVHIEGNLHPYTFIRDLSSQSTLYVMDEQTPSHQAVSRN